MTPPARSPAVEALIEEIRTHLCCQSEKCYRSHVARLALNALAAQAQQLAQAEQERDAHWADLCEVKAGEGLIARALYDEAMKRAGRAEQTVAQFTRERDEARK